jgi:hypothetical protein
MRMKRPVGVANPNCPEDTAVPKGLPFLIRTAEAMQVA